ncbi:LAME_0B08064g1_1 [Lachancea meyersii CBS 8951]|uniref:LAME_0B08064g1_1 n=1 Tax=Lachancea meyersii CBS 8951 TaxID=1266667 RepID=A0A1G4IX34_9SACH|nr:LAME_0B08064g1_1 [Lachancea meyersii CBS 8951]
MSSLPFMVPIITSVLSLEGELIEVSERDADKALHYALDTQGIELYPEIERALIRKIYWCILPIVAALMSCQLMDKTTNSYASSTKTRCCCLHRLPTTFNGLDGSLT